MSVAPLRASVAALALLGCGIAVYLARYEMGLAASVWDPVFGSASSEAVLTSGLTRALPVPDAVLGACAYLLEVVLAVAGLRRPWREASVVVIGFALVAAGLAVAAIGLLLTQVLVVHALCTLCLTSAAISLVNAALAGGDIAAAVRLVRTDTRRSCHQPS